VSGSGCRRPLTPGVLSDLDRTIKTFDATPLQGELAIENERSRQDEAQGQRLCVKGRIQCGDRFEMRFAGNGIAILVGVVEGFERRTVLGTRSASELAGSAA
jgi:hypothetical protein